MALVPKLALTLAFVATSFFGYDDWFNIPDLTTLDAAVYDLQLARPMPVSSPRVLEAKQAGPWDPQRTWLMPAATSPAGTGRASMFIYSQRSAPRSDRNAIAAHQYVWFVEENGVSRTLSWPTAESLARRVSANGSLRLNLPKRDSVVSTWPAASSFPSWHLVCFRRGA
jgi:hypothetical protein